MPKLSRLGFLLLWLLAGAAFAQADVRLEVTESYSLTDSFLGEDGYTSIVGMVENTGTVRVSFIQIDMLIRSDGRTLREFTFADRRVLLPGERSTFSTWLDKGVTVDSYELSLSAMPAFFLPERNVEVGFWHPVEDPFGPPDIEGVVKNTGSRPAQWVKVVVAGYDASGQLAAVGGGLVDKDVISPGDMSAFEVHFLRSRAPVVSYELWAQSLDPSPF